MEFEGQFSSEVDTVVDFAVPPEYKVILLNDDFTTKEFVVDVLISVFHKNEAEALYIMESVHRSGRGIAGIYTYDIAATRVNLTIKKAREQGFPLKCILEEN